MILAGVFDRFPDLQIILGHWGEMILFYLDRIGILDRTSGLQRSIADYFRTNVPITPGGILSHHYLRWATEVVGIDRILHATDYPYNSITSAHYAAAFLNDAPLTDIDRVAVGSGNWERIVADKRRCAAPARPFWCRRTMLHEQFLPVSPSDGITPCQSAGKQSDCAGPATITRRPADCRE